MCECSKQNLVNVEPLRDPRERKVFKIISENPSKFTEVKKETGFHQEVTSRILRRLANRVIIRKTGGFYDLCCNGAKLKAHENDEVRFEGMKR